MSEPKWHHRLRDWFGGKAFRLTCWLYGLDPAQTILERSKWEA